MGHQSYYHNNELSGKLQVMLLPYGYQLKTNRSRKIQSHRMGCGIYFKGHDYLGCYLETASASLG